MTTSYRELTKDLPPRFPQGDPRNYERSREVSQRLHNNPPDRKLYLEGLKRERDHKQARLVWLYARISKIEEELGEREGSPTETG